MEEEPTTQWLKEKDQKDKQRSTKYTHKTEDRVTRTPLKTGVELRCPGRVSSSCSTSGTRRVQDQASAFFTTTLSTQLNVRVDILLTCRNHYITSQREEVWALKFNIDTFYWSGCTEAPWIYNKVHSSSCLLHRRSWHGISTNSPFYYYPVKNNSI